MDARMVGIGALFLFVSSLVGLEAELVATRPPLVVIAGASICLAVGSVVVRRDIRFR